MSKVAAFVDKVMAKQSEVKMEGFADLFQHLGLSLENEEAFVFVWKMDCKGPWSVTRDALVTGLGAISKDPSPKEIASAMKKWKKEIATDPKTFQAFFDHCFYFCRNSGSANQIPTDEAIAYIKVLLPLNPKKTYTMENQFLDFISAKTKVVSADLWKHIPQFLSKTKNDLSNFDDSLFWPTVVDDYVEANKK